MEKTDEKVERKPGNRKTGSENQKQLKKTPKRKKNKKNEKIKKTGKSKKHEIKIQTNSKKRWKDEKKYEQIGKK